MPLALSPPRQIETGRVDDFSVPMSKFLSVAFEQGVHDSMFNSVFELSEWSMSNEGRLLEPTEANERYGLPTLKFDSRVYESEARLLNERKQAELRRSFYLGQGNPGGLLSGRGLAGLGVSTLASFTNPLDFSVNFMPVVGSEAMAARMASMGKGTFRQSLARGLITSEALASKLPLAPKLTESLIEGFVGNMIAEIPHVVNEITSKGNYTIEESLVGVVAGTAIGGALHLGLTSAMRTWKYTHGSTKEAMLRRAVDNFVKGEDVRVHELVSIDEAVVRERIKFDMQVAREQALHSIPLDEVRATIREKHGEFPTVSAVKLSDGTILAGRPGQLHVMIDGVADLSPERYEGADFGFMTDKGRFVSGDEAAALVGKDVSDGQRLASEELHYIDPEFLTDEEQLIFNDAKEQLGTDAHGVNAVRRHRKERANAIFFSRPEIQELVKNEHERRVQEYVNKERESWDEEGRFRKEVRAEMDRQIAEGKTLTQEQAREWGFDDVEKTANTVKEQADELERQIQELADELDEELSGAPGEDQGTRIEDVLEKLKIDTEGKLLEGVTGMPVWLWNGAIDAVIAAIKAGRVVKDAIQEGVKWIEKQRIKQIKSIENRFAVETLHYEWATAEDNEVNATRAIISGEFGDPPEFTKEQISQKIEQLKNNPEFRVRVDDMMRNWPDERIPVAQLLSEAKEQGRSEKQIAEWKKRLEEERKNPPEPIIKQFESKLREQLGVKERGATDMSRRTSLMEPEAVKIASKEVDATAKGVNSGIDAAVNCLTNLKIHAD